MVLELDRHYIKRKETIENIVRNAIDENNIEMDQVTFDNLIIHLSLCVSREFNGSYIATSESQMDQLKKHEYYKVSKGIIKEMEQEFNVSIDTNQINYTTLYLAHINLIDMDFHYEFDLFDDIMEEVINETVTRIRERLDTDLRENEAFYNGITLHFYPALERLQNDTQLTENPLKDIIQIKHEKEFKCAKIFNEVVQEYYNKSFNDSELAYISLHFATAFPQDDSDLQ
ncbi:MAG: PRD domain-containing protein [Erysipelotrichaceae bacterium]|nr:PRD domain-containing protein [Erysipelotrichaceae bacterium]